MILFFYTSVICKHLVSIIHFSRCLFTVNNMTVCFIVYSSRAFMSFCLDTNQWKPNSIFKLTDSTKAKLLSPSQLDFPPPSLVVLAAWLPSAKCCKTIQFDLRLLSKCSQAALLPSIFFSNKSFFYTQTKPQRHSPIWWMRCCSGSLIFLYHLQILH